MKNLSLLFFITLTAITSLAQESFTFTFSGVNNTSYVQPDSVKVTNQSQMCDTMLYWPDTALHMIYVGTPEFIENRNELKILPAQPNPVHTQTSVSVYAPSRQKVSISISDMHGKTEISQNHILENGINNFLFKPGNSKLYVFNVQSESRNTSIKILSTGSQNRQTQLSYSGFEGNNSPLKNTEKRLQTNESFSFTPGDTLLIVSYLDTLESGSIKMPEASQDYTFQFAFNIPCPGLPTVNYGGIEYNTVQILNQCWIKENLNIGTMISSTWEMEDNEEIEKYCYDNQLTNCDIYGGLYQWDEMMQYISEEGSQGICPPGDGWHIPTNAEWKILEGATDSLYNIGDPTWYEIYYRGYDAGKNLKSTSGWNNDMNGTDFFGFNATPGGVRLTDGTFNSLVFRGYWATSSESITWEVWRHYLDFNFDKIGHSSFSKQAGLSVRCVRD